MTSKIQKEGSLRLDFREAQGVERLDEQGIPAPEGMRLVDFVVEERGHMLLVEVKDPSQSAATPKARKDFSESMLNGGLINEKLVPKARDGYTFLHLMERDKKRFLFVVLLGLEALENETALLMGFKDRLFGRIRFGRIRFGRIRFGRIRFGRIRNGGRGPWRRHYVSDCLVVTTRTWADHFPDYRVSRIAS